MRNVDFIVVGLGIGGVAISEQLRNHGNSFVTFSGPQAAASAVAGGVVNPVVLKRFSPVWRAAEFMNLAPQWYTDLSELLDVQVMQAATLYRVLASVEEMNQWAVASDKRELSTFMDPQVIPNSHLAVNAPYGFGQVTGAFRVFPGRLLKAYADFLEKKEHLLRDSFHYNELHLEKGGVRYRDLRAKAIIFAEGYSVVDNPWFEPSRIIPNKGEYITIKAPDLQLQHILKGSMFVIPLGDDLYRVGATFSRDQRSHETTTEARVRLVKEVSKILGCFFEVTAQQAGIRPTTKDHRPILGKADGLPAYFLNGFGSRGLLMAPLLASWLYNHIIHGTPLPEEVSLGRWS